MSYVVTWQRLSARRICEVFVWGEQPLLAASELFTVDHQNTSGVRSKKEKRAERRSGNHMIFYLWLNSGMGTVCGEVIDVQKSFFFLFFKNNS